MNKTQLPPSLRKMSIKSRRASGAYNLRDFESFFQGWVVRQETYRERLRSALRRPPCSEEHLRELVGGVLAHYQQYYEEKSRMANHDVWLVFSPPWFSCLEQSFLWIAGFKPGLAFRMVGASVDDMSPEQAEMMERLRAETRDQERSLEKELAGLQESVAAPPVVLELTRSSSSSSNVDVIVSMEALQGAMELLVAKADTLRTRTAERLVEILTPLQNVKFLAAVTDLHTKITTWGCHLHGDTPLSNTSHTYYPN